MHVITEYTTELPGPIIDVDIADDGRILMLYGEDSNRRIQLDGREVAIDPEYCPDRVRLVGTDYFLTAGITRQGYCVAVFDLDGLELWSVETGGDIEDVNVIGRWIVIGFGDMNGSGVLVLPIFGDSKFRYNDVFGRDAVDSTDCYCLCQVNENSLVFFPYVGFPLVFWDLSASSQRIVPAPESVAGSMALTIRNTTCYFFAPYHDEGVEPRSIFERKIRGIYSWQVGAESAEKIGDFPSTFQRIRGLPGGRFLAFEDDYYSIITL